MSVAKKHKNEEVDPYMFHLEVIVYGYCRYLSQEFELEFPPEIMRLCYLWFHPNTITLRVSDRTGKILNINIIPTDKILNIKQQIEDKEGYAPNQQVLVLPHLGKTLKDHLRICDYNMHNNTTLLVNVAMRGGGGAVPLPSATANNNNNNPINPYALNNQQQSQENADIQTAIRLSLRDQQQQQQQQTNNNNNNNDDGSPSLNIQQPQQQKNVTQTQQQHNTTQWSVPSQQPRRRQNNNGLDEDAQIQLAIAASLSMQASSSLSQSTSKWNCSACTFENVAAATKCTICYTNRL